MSGIQRLAACAMIALSLPALLGTRALAAETPPPYIFGSAAIAPGVTLAYVTNRFITPGSTVILGVDTTAWPGSPIALPGLRVQTVGTGFFAVRALDFSAAPRSGIPFNYVVFPGDAAPIANASVGTAAIPAGTNAVAVNLPTVFSSSSIMLTVQGLASSPGLKIHTHGSGVFTVATLDGSNAPAGGMSFSYLVNNGAFPSGAGFVPAGASSTAIGSSFVSNPVGLFVTVDTTAAPTLSTLPSIKVRSHGAGIFYVGTANLTVAPSTGVRFTWISVQPPARFEEAGPQSLSGNAWSLVTIPDNYLVQYAGSMGGGIWKTTNGGDSWAQIGPNGGFGGFRRLFVDSIGTLWALARTGILYSSPDGGSSWQSIPQPVPGLVDSTGNDGGGFGAQPSIAIVPRVIQGDTFPFRVAPAPAVCSEGGAFYYDGVAGKWKSVRGGGFFGPILDKCTDIVATPSVTLLATRYYGLWVDSGSGLGLVRSPHVSGATLRVAIGSRRVLLVDDTGASCPSPADPTQMLPCYSVYYSDDLLNGASSPTFKAVAGPASSPGLVPSGGSQGGYALSAAISPTNDDHFIIGGVFANVTSDGGTTWSGSPGIIDPDIHQIAFWNDSVAIGVGDLGTRLLTDGGLHWREANTTHYFTDGPPISRLYTLGVSLADQYGRVLAGGNAQDTGGLGILGRNGGLLLGAGEAGLTVIAPRPLNLHSADGTPLSSRFRVYGTDTSATGNPKQLFVSNSEVAGPDYFTDPSVHPTGEGHDASGLTVLGNSVLPAAVTAIAVSRAGVDRVLVGLSNNEVWRARPGTNGLMYECVPPFCTPFNLNVTALYFASDDLAYVGYSNGAIFAITSPFGTPTWTNCGTPQSGSQVLSFASQYGNSSEVYAATGRQVDAAGNTVVPSKVWRGDGCTWTDLTTGNLASYLAVPTLPVDIVGLARDDNNPYLYVGLGHRVNGGLGDSAWGPNQGCSFLGPAPFRLRCVGEVFRTQTPAPGPNGWEDFADSVRGHPITGIGISPNRALYVSTQGRGIWWRRDVAAVPPNSGVNTPDEGDSRIGRKQSFVTRCSYPGTWRNIHAIDFKLAMGSGPGDGEPLAVWAQFDQDRGVVRFYDPDAGTNSLHHHRRRPPQQWAEGTPGSHRVLTSRFARLNLAKTRVRGLASEGDPTTVEITWSITFRPSARGDLQQYLRVADKFGASTNWDRVGDWRVASRKGVH